MATDAPPEPWRSFLADIDAAATENLCFTALVALPSVSTTASQDRRVIWTWSRWRRTRHAV